ncbi:Interleukin-17 receptor E [Varanus komodoensis]|uniref:interleukin-17 receptor E n=1 Tax=Varanus komodoensis TaxID=61221 RepID=UPI001CF77069|nr:interleukin-17 receptor E [Varanus komodoensis]KAF7250050.1 Interleukin-17 receptor E [Varanus komodoensis]
MGSPTPSALLLPTVFLLSCLPAATRNHLPLARLQVLTNFDCRTHVHGILPKPRCQRKLREGLPLPLPTLALTTVQLCRGECQPCVRVHVALNATGIEGLELHFLVLSSNRPSWLQVLRKRRHQTDSGALWQMQFDCFLAESGQKVLVSLETIPNGVLSLNQSLLVTLKQTGPEFHHTWVPATRAIGVSVPEGPAITVRLCHQLALECEELQQPFHQQVSVSKDHPAVLPYEFLLPCLCIEASYEHLDGLRKKVCPFQDQPEAYGSDLWSSTQFHDYSISDKAKMVMSLNGRCPLQPDASLCWKESAAPGAACQDIPNSTVTVFNQEYVLKEVDVHPQLCFKFSYMNSSHIECPHQTDTAWNVSLSATFLQLHLKFHSRIPASFSSAICQQQSSSKCELKPPVYTITHPEGSALKDQDLILPWRALKSCVLVWRSDVRFAGKQLLCPNVVHRHWGLLAFAVGLGLGFLVAVVLLIRWCLHRLHRDIPRKRCSRPILLIYSPDSEEHKQLVCAFAALLHSALGCPVLLDLWELGHVGRLGILPWMYAQREHVGREHGQVLLLWSAGSAHAYGLWQGKASRDGGKAPESHDLFGAAMACLQGELQCASGTVQQSDWVIAYFSKLCGRRDIPHALRFLPRYRLPQELPGLVRVLQGPSSSTPSWLHASAKAMVCHLLKAEKKKGPRSRLYQPWRTTTEKLAGSLAPLTHPKLCRPSCT